MSSSMLSHSSPDNLCKHWLNTTALMAGVECQPCHRMHYGREFCPEHKETTASLCMGMLHPEAVYDAIRGRQPRVKLHAVSIGYHYLASINRDTLLEDAYREIGVLGDGQTLDGSKIEKGHRALMLLLGSLAQKDIRGEFATVRKRVTLFLQKGQEKYSIGGSDHCTASYGSTTALEGLQASEPTGMEEVEAAAAALMDHWPARPAADLEVQATLYPRLPALTAFALATGLQSPPADLLDPEGKNGVSLLLAPV